MTAPTQDGAPRRPRRVVWKEPPITIGDRLAAAVVCVLAMAGTAAALALLVFFFGGGDAITSEGWSLFLRLQVAFVAFAAVAGFVLGPEHATAMFGRLWGTEGVDGGRGPVLLILAFDVLATVMALFG